MKIEDLLSSFQTTLKFRNKHWQGTEIDPGICKISEFSFPTDSSESADNHAWVDPHSSVLWAI